MSKAMYWYRVEYRESWWSAPDEVNITYVTATENATHDYLLFRLYKQYGFPKDSESFVELLNFTRVEPCTMRLTNNE